MPTAGVLAAQIPLWVCGLLSLCFLPEICGTTTFQEYGRGREKTTPFSSEDTAPPSGHLREQQGALALLAQKAKPILEPHLEISEKSGPSLTSTDVETGPQRAVDPAWPLGGVSSSTEPRSGRQHLNLLEKHRGISQRVRQGWLQTPAFSPAHTAFLH